MTLNGFEVLAPVSAQMPREFLPPTPKSAFRILRRTPCSLTAFTTIWTCGCGSSVRPTIAYRCLSANSSLAKSFTASINFLGGVAAGIENRILCTSFGCERSLSGPRSTQSGDTRRTPEVNPRAIQLMNGDLLASRVSLH